MSPKKQNLSIPLLSIKDSVKKQLFPIEHLLNVIESFKQIVIERIVLIERKIEAIDKKPVIDYSKDLESIKKDAGLVNNLFIKTDDIKKELTYQINNYTEDIFKNNFDNLVKVLNESIGTYYKSNYELFEKFKVIEHNTNINLESLKEFIKFHPHDPLDYLFITENFNKLTEHIKRLEQEINRLVDEKNTNKYQNPYIYETIYYKDLPIAEFTNYSKAIVYKGGLFKNKILFYKNDGKKWVKI